LTAHVERCAHEETPVHDLKWTESEKKLARRVFESALAAELAGLSEDKLSPIRRIASL
jgi:hypothetical protein